MHPPREGERERGFIAMRKIGSRLTLVECIIVGSNYIIQCVRRDNWCDDDDDGFLTFSTYVRI